MLPCVLLRVGVLLPVSERIPFRFMTVTAAPLNMNKLFKLPNITTSLGVWDCVSISHYGLQFMAKLCPKNSTVYCINYLFRTEVINLIFLLQIFLVLPICFLNYYFTLLSNNCLNIDFIWVKFVVYLLCRQLGNCCFTTGVCYTMYRVSMFIVTTP